LKTKTRKKKGEKLIIGLKMVENTLNKNNYW
jgi:hypothetical protein